MFWGLCILNQATHPAVNEYNLYPRSKQPTRSSGLIAEKGGWSSAAEPVRGLNQWGSGSAKSGCFNPLHYAPDDLVQNPTWAKLAKSAGKSAGKGAGRQGGAGRSAGQGAVPSFSQWKGPCQHLCQHSCQHPLFASILCQFRPVWFLYQVVRIVTLAAECKITPPYCAIPFRDCRGGIATILPYFHQGVPSSRKIIHVIFSWNKLCKRIFIHIRYSSSPRVSSVKISGHKRARPRLDHNLPRIAVFETKPVKPLEWCTQFFCKFVREPAPRAANADCEEPWPFPKRSQNHNSRADLYKGTWQETSKYIRKIWAFADIVHSALWGGIAEIVSRHCTVQGQ